MTVTGIGVNGEVLSLRQLVYVAENCTQIFLSRTVCRELGIIPSSFPVIGGFNSGEVSGVTNQKTSIYAETEVERSCKCSKRQLPPQPPTSCPYDFIDENIDKIQDWIIDYYSSSTFNQCNEQPLPLINTSLPLSLFIDKEAKPVACHRAVPVPLHYEEQVKKDLEKDVRLGVIERVPPNTPSTWCSRMLIQTKKSGKP